MGKLALLLVLAATAAGLHHASTAGKGLRSTAAQSAEQQRLVLTRTAAQSGWARAKNALAQNFVGSTITGENEGIAYTTTSVVTGARALVTSVGRMPQTGRSGETTYTIVYSLLKNVSGALNPRPRFMTYAITAGGSMMFTGSSDVVQLGVTDASRDTTTLAVHANVRLNAGGSSVIRGFGHYSGSVAPNVDANFQPVYNPRGLATVRQTPAVDIPPIVPDDLVAQDGVDYSYPGGTSLSNVVLPGGTRADPAIYRFRGAVSLSDVTFAGYVIIVADGNVSGAGTVQGQSIGYTGPQESALAIYTPGTVNLGGNAQVYAQIVAGAGMAYTGSVRVYGSVAVRGDYSQGGSAMVQYRPSSAALTQVFTGRPGLAFTLLAVREQ